MRQRRSGCSSTGSSDASWPQYSNARPVETRRSAKLRGWSPRREKSVSSCARAMTFTESSCTAPTRPNNEVACRSVAPPLGRATEKPCAPNTQRRASSALSGVDTLFTPLFVRLFIGQEHVTQCESVGMSLRGHPSETPCRYRFRR